MGFTYIEKDINLFFLKFYTYIEVLIEQKKYELINQFSMRIEPFYSITMYTAITCNRVGNSNSGKEDG